MRGFATGVAPKADIGARRCEACGRESAGMYGNVDAAMPRERDTVGV